MLPIHACDYPADGLWDSSTLLRAFLAMEVPPLAIPTKFPTAESNAQVGAAHVNRSPVAASAWGVLL